MIGSALKQAASSRNARLARERQFDKSGAPATIRQDTGGSNAGGRSRLTISALKAPDSGGNRGGGFVVHGFPDSTPACASSSSKENFVPPQLRRLGALCVRARRRALVIRWAVILLLVILASALKMFQGRHFLAKISAAALPPRRPAAVELPPPPPPLLLQLLPAVAPTRRITSLEKQL